MSSVEMDAGAVQDANRSKARALYAEGSRGRRQWGFCQNALAFAISVVKDPGVGQSLKSEKSIPNGDLCTQMPHSYNH